MSTDHAVAHTPGPWQARGSKAGAHVVGGNPLTLIVAFGHDEAFEQNEANARLIAAAPDLLAALDRMVIETRGCEEGGDLWLARKIAIEAIAKAEGR